jgi:hypothetical protein
VDGSNSIILGWSPDGEWQILSAETDRELVIRRVEDETILPIASDVSVAAWSPDAASVAYIQAGELWIGEVSCLLSASENCARQETQTDATVEDVAWSYNGQTLFYLQRQSNSFRRLYALQPENGTATALTSTELDIKQVVSLPASTKLLVVDSSRTGGTGGVYFYDIGLSLLDPEDESLTRLVTFSRNQFGTECRGGLCPGGGTVSFSPDGDLVAVTFTAQSDQAQSLYVLNLACLEATTDACNYSTSNPYWSAVATDNGADAGYPSWSSDGSLLSYIQARRTDFDHAVDSSGRNIGGDVYVVRIDRDGETIVTGVPVQVTSLGFVDFKFALWRLY